MGGHGGLNILPQKRWNVYGRDNRLKVARDEAAHAAQQAEQDEKHRAAEAQARRQLLLERAKQRRQAALGGHADALEGSRDGSASDADADLELQQHEQRSAGQRKPSAHARQQQGSAHRSLDDPGSRAHKRQRVQEDLQDHQQLQAQQQHQQGQQLSTADDVQEERALKHINFWEELETKAQHPERQAEERANKKRRGDPKTHTSDERFDESFQFANGLTGPKPWYARAIDRSASDRLPQQPGQPQQQMLQQQQPQGPGLGQAALLAADDTHKHKQRRRRHSSSSESDSDSGSNSSSDSDSEGGRKRRKHRRHKHNGGSSSKEHRRKHQKSKDKGSRHRSRSATGKAAADEDAAKALALAKLRAERLEREAAERHRALQATGLLPPTKKRFNSSFGYAEALRQSQVGAAGMAATARGASAAAVAGLSQRFRG